MCLWLILRICVVFAFDCFVDAVAVGMLFSLWLISIRGCCGF